MLPLTPDKPVMLIVVCGMLRSGSTLQYQAACALVEAAGLSPLVDGRAHSAGLGWDWPTVMTSHSTSDRWHVVKVHDPNPTIEASLSPSGMRYVYSYRDLRDVAASWIAKEQIDVSKPPSVALDFVPNALESYAHFTRQPRVLLTRYETMVANIEECVRAMRDFLHLAVTDEACRDIAMSLNFDSQRGRIAQTDWRSGQLWDSKSLLHRNHLRDGAIGKFRHELPAAYIDHIESIGGDWLMSHGYPLSTPSRVPSTARPAWVA